MTYNYAEIHSAKCVALARLIPGLTSIVFSRKLDAILLVLDSNSKRSFKNKRDLVINGEYAVDELDFRADRL